MNNKFYPCADKVHGIELSKQSNMKGKITGEFRPPKAGEWFLSGAIPHCYYTKNDLSTSYYIVKIVPTKTTIITEEIS